MKSLMKYLSLWFVIFLFASIESQAKDCIPPKPNPPRLVNDFAGFLEPTARNQLEKDLEEFARETSNQIVLVTLNDLCGLEPFEMANKIGDRWGVGQKQFDNGIVILIKPKTPESKGQVFIAIGKGLEGIIPDAIAKRIVEVEMIPKLKKGQNLEAIQSAVKVLKDLSVKEYSYKDYSKRTSSKPWVPLLIIILFIVIVAVFSKRTSYSVGKRGRRIYYGGWGGGFGSGGFGGGSSGGGFGGFGGGSFGGGGAGGSW